MIDVVIVGDGPAGLSAALFLAKRGMSTLVFGQDETPMHSAMLYNYLGIPEISGTEFQRIGRQQVESFGASVRDVRVTSVVPTDEGFETTTEDGQRHVSRYVILATGPKAEFAEGLQLARGDDGVLVDRNGRTAIDRLYAIGWSTRKQKIQAVISAAEGAAAALDILSTEAGKDLHDFDVPPKPGD